MVRYDAASGSSTNAVGRFTVGATMDRCCRRQVAPWDAALTPALTASDIERQSMSAGSTRGPPRLIAVRTPTMARDVVVLVGSLRKASLNRKMANALRLLSAGGPLALSVVEIGSLAL